VVESTQRNACVSFHGCIAARKGGSGCARSIAALATSANCSELALCELALSWAANEPSAMLSAACTAASLLLLYARSCWGGGGCGAPDRAVGWDVAGDHSVLAEAAPVGVSLSIVQMQAAHRDQRATERRAFRWLNALDDRGRVHQEDRSRRREPASPPLNCCPFSETATGSIAAPAPVVKGSTGA